MVDEKELKQCTLRAILFALFQFLASLICILAKITYLEYIFIELICRVRKISDPINEGLIKSWFFNQLSMSLSFNELQNIRNNYHLFEEYRTAIKLVNLFTDVNNIENHTGEKYCIDTNKLFYELIKRKNNKLEYMKIKPIGKYRCFQPCEKLLLMHSWMFIRSIFSKEIFKIVKFIFRVETIYVLEIQII